MNLQEIEKAISLNEAILNGLRIRRKNFGLESLSAKQRQNSRLLMEKLRDELKKSSKQPLKPRKRK